MKSNCKSKLQPQIETIMKMWSENKSLETIKRKLAGEKINIKCERSTIYRFITKTLSL
jgi:hypothetical protein